MKPGKLNVIELRKSVDAPLVEPEIRESEVHEYAVKFMRHPLPCGK